MSKPFPVLFKLFFAFFTFEQVQKALLSRDDLFYFTKKIRNVNVIFCFLLILLMFPCLWEKKKKRHELWLMTLLPSLTACFDFPLTSSPAHHCPISGIAIYLFSNSLHLSPSPSPCSLQTICWL